MGKGRASSVDLKPASVSVYRRDVVIEGRVKYALLRGGGPRGGITGLTASSARRFFFTVRNGPRLRLFGCLTYPGEYERDMTKVKRGHLSSFRKRLVRRGYLGVWMLHFQDRGAAHYHVLCDLPGLQKDGLGAERRWWSRAWYDVVGSGDVLHLGAGTNLEWLRCEDGAVRYAAKYMRDSKQLQAPGWCRSPGRYWGAFGGFETERTGIERSDRAVQAGRLARRARSAGLRDLGSHGSLRWSGVHRLCLCDVADVVRQGGFGV